MISNFWKPFTSFADVIVQTVTLDLNVDETLSLIRSLEVTRGCIALVLEPYQHHMESGGRVCRSFWGTSSAN